MQLWYFHLPRRIADAWLIICTSLMHMPIVLCIHRYDERVDRVLRLGDTEALARGLFFGSTGMTGNFIMLSVLWYANAPSTLLSQTIFLLM